MATEAPLCSLCGRRPAVYYRSYSGHRLCRKDLVDTARRLVSRSLSRANPSPRSVIAVPVVSFSPGSSLLLAELVASIERRFPSKVVTLVPSALSGAVAEAISKMEGALGEVVYVDVSVSPPAELDAIDCVRYERAWALRAARGVGADILAMPLSRTDLAMLLLESALLRGEGISEAMPMVSVGDVRVVAGFGEAERELVAALEFLEGLSDVRPACAIRFRSKRVFMSIYGRPEVDYGGIAIAEALYSVAAKSMRRCAVCGGLSREGEVCGTCLRLGLTGLSAIPRPAGPTSHLGPS